MLASRDRRWGRSSLLLTALVVVLAFVVPASASAAIYTVNSIGDQPDAVAGAPCEASGGGLCTLRAAIEVSNSSGGIRDEIKFSPLFNGESLGTITYGSAMVPITDPVTIDGDGNGQCTTEAGPKGPCVEINPGTSALNGLEVVGADGVTIEGVAIFKANTGIAAEAGAEGLTVKNTWTGFGLDGTSGFTDRGILLGPGADGATIGGPEPVERDVIANTTFEGLDIQGASEAVVSGNWFGFSPDGASIAANRKDVEVTSVPGSIAHDNRIGSNVGGASETPECDGGCNAMAVAGERGIDMLGDDASETPAEFTLIRGNFIGLHPDGSAEEGPFSSAFDILVGESVSTEIGGSDPGSANHINGGSYGIITAASADHLEVKGNLFGLTADGSNFVTPPFTAIFDDSTGLTFASSASITDNKIIAVSGGILQSGTGAVIEANEIGFGAAGQRIGSGGAGITLYGGAGGSDVSGNSLFGTTGEGIVIENANNLIVSNTIEEAETAGILLYSSGGSTFATGNEIGGPGEVENTISGSGYAAIEMAGEQVLENRVFSNHGAGNEGPFIDLGGDGPGVSGPGAPQGGVQPPTIDAVASTSVSGTSLPEAEIIVYRKATPAIGEIAATIATVTASAGGEWSATFAQLPGSTSIAATQAGEKGTSELRIATTPAPPKEEERIACPQSSGGCGPCCGPARLAPDTKIAKKPKPNGSPTAKFKFTSSISGSSFECKLDKKKFAKCRSPKTYKKLKPGKHVFKVRAVSPHGVVDPSPATKKFKVSG